MAAVGQTVALAKSSDSASTTAVSSATSVGKSATSATILKPHTFTMTARPSPPSNAAATKNPTSISSLKPSSVANLKQASLILSQEGVASPHVCCRRCSCWWQISSLDLCCRSAGRGGNSDGSNNAASSCCSTYSRCEKTLLRLFGYKV